VALAVEDGTGLANAESYVSVADAGAYAAARGLIFPVSTAPEIALAEQALRRATEWIDAKYGARFAGTWAVDGQALAWPRLYANYRLAALPSDEVPPQIIAATVQAAVRELAAPGSLTPDVTPGKIKKRVRVEGAVEVEYAAGSGGVASQTLAILVLPVALAISFWLGTLGEPQSEWLWCAVMGLC
jgi:hypothetical protein